MDAPTGMCDTPRGRCTDIRPSLQSFRQIPVWVNSPVRCDSHLLVFESRLPDPPAVETSVAAVVGRCRLSSVVGRCRLPSVALLSASIARHRLRRSHGATAVDTLLDLCALSQCAAPLGQCPRWHFRCLDVRERSQCPATLGKFRLRLQSSATPDAFGGWHRWSEEAPELFPRRRGRCEAAPGVVSGSRSRWSPDALADRCSGYQAVPGAVVVPENLRCTPKFQSNIIK